MDQTELFYRFGAALTIGLLVGLQREHAASQSDNELFAGARTFALLGLIGCTAALAAQELASPWPFVAVLTVLGALLVAAYVMTTSRSGNVGATTEVAALATTLSGAMCYWGLLELAVAIAVATTLVLSIKPFTETFAARLTRTDVYATLKFAIITAIVLPILPNETFGPPPLDVLNPQRVWLMVVFISGISFLGYVLFKAVGARRGIGLTGVLGGLVSSTAVTLSFAQRSREAPELARPFALAILASWILMFARILVEIVAVNAELLRAAAPPILAAAAAALAFGFYLLTSRREASSENVSLTNPFELGPAIQFGALYAVILVLARAGQTYFGDTGIYLSSVVAGVADVDAITLSMAELSRAGGSVDQSTAGRAIMLAAASNTVVKAGIVAAAGSATIRRLILPAALLILLAGLGAAFAL